MIFFDIDGTLCNHKHSEYIGMMSFYSENKKDLKHNEDEFYELWRTISERNYKKYLEGQLTFKQQQNQRMKELFSLSGAILSDDEAESKFKTYLRCYESNWRAFDDVMPCLRELKGERLGIITNGDLEQQLLKLEKMGIRGYFDTIIASGDVGVAKPDIKIFDIACGKAEVNLKGCYYIGDDLNNDILSCEKAGMKGIWINRKGCNTQEARVRKVNNLEMIREYI